ncbi:unnamed protein product [Paramecium pentaurelia]|uniref:C2H2-type domain-containing protein n=1 Tax=Paramecium pentaurelia TaxID=43138 RepID=A0A8S1UU34_9CILI|nr:unnamed protein product [Paramecium pentaurelia]
MEIESEDINSLQISDLTLKERVNQNKTIQSVLDVEKIYDYLNLSDSPQERDCSCDMFQDINKITTKKDNFIIKKNDLIQYQCGYCQKLFSYSYSLGGHIQKLHKKEKNQKASLPSIILRKRPIRYCQH